MYVEICISWTSRATKPHCIIVSPKKMVENRMSNRIIYENSSTSRMEKKIKNLVPKDPDMEIGSSQK